MGIRLGHWTPLKFTTLFTCNCIKVMVLSKPIFGSTVSHAMVTKEDFIKRPILVDNCDC